MRWTKSNKRPPQELDSPILVCWKNGYERVGLGIFRHDHLVRVLIYHEKFGWTDGNASYDMNGTSWKKFKPPKD